MREAYDQIGDLHDAQVAPERCRLVKYNEFYDTIDCSWDSRLDDTIDDVFEGIRSTYKFDLLLEMIGEGQQFQLYTPGSLSVKVLLVDVDTKELETPISVRMAANSTVGHLKENIKGIAQQHISKPFYQVIYLFFFFIFFYFFIFFFIYFFIIYFLFIFLLFFFILFFIYFLLIIIYLLEFIKFFLSIQHVEVFNN